jgi:hypothetical protein
MFTSIEGKKGYHHCEELDEALRFVERLRNHEGVHDAQVFRMEEVVLEVKQYYKVEVAGGAPAAPAPAAPAEHYGEPVMPVVGEVPVDAMAVAAGPEPVLTDGRPSFSIFSSKS